jgi:hypothetical protein
VIAFKFLARGAVSPFTGFHWPPPGAWVRVKDDRADAWVHACRPGDLPHWLDEELWRVELEEPVREARYQVAAPGARLVGRVAEWDEGLARAYARACALRARDLAIPHLEPAAREALSAPTELQAIAAAAGAAAAISRAAGFVADAAYNAQHVGPATTSYIAAVLASSLGGGLAAFEGERAWQARWLSERLGLGREGDRNEPRPASY